MGIEHEADDVRPPGPEPLRRPVRQVTDLGGDPLHAASGGDRDLSMTLHNGMMLEGMDLWHGAGAILSVTHSREVPCRGSL